MVENTKITVAFCTDGIFPLAIGGIQRHSALLIRELALIPQLHIHVIHPHEQRLFAEFATITEHHLQPIDVQKNYLRECYAYSGRVANVLDNVVPDVVYAQGLTVWKNCKRYASRLINNPHGLESFQAIGTKEKLIGLLFQRVQKKIFRQSAYIASEGGHLTTILKKNGFASKIVFLPNAVTLPQAFKTHYPEKNEPLRVFFMARFVKNKGIHILYQAIEKLNAEGFTHKYSFVLGGKGPLFEKYKNEFTYTNVELKGFLSDEELADEYLKADVFILPTLFEGMPTVVLEAMAVGLPVIVSDVGGTPELIDAETGYLIQRNSVNQVYNALKAYAQLSAHEKQQLGTNARAKVQHGFTWQKLAQDHLALFKKITGKN